MEQRPLGQTGISVSAFGLGVMTFGGQTPEEDAFGQLDRAFAAGVTFFDTAECYPSPISSATQGQSEAILGRWIMSRGIRDRVVIGTKVSGPGSPVGDMSHIRGKDRRLDGENIRQAVEHSLRRLKTDYIDLYQVHWPERVNPTFGRSRYSYIPDKSRQVSIEETLLALGRLKDEGKIRAIGICNETPWGAMHYLSSAERHGLARIASIQNSYSLLDRSFELGLAEVAVREQVGLIAWSPLAGGLLTGKYGLDGQAISGSRSSDGLVHFSNDRRRATLAYAEIAKANGLSLPNMALAFARQMPFMTSVLIGASSLSQLEMNLGALDIGLSEDVTRAINEVHDRGPNPL
ncbi:NADP(H)-dependent aldo-keto reductase [Sphingomonas oligophenolica]|uniref:Aldo/keto reductase n=1 Tax=Sphingomonas oligophenolica TaxID=301154 RepID=A0ABU9YA38_9SPHN